MPDRPSSPYSWLVAPVVVLVFAALVRLPHYDVSWFGNDQIAFVAEARRILAGDWSIVGPRAAGFNIIGPLYSYFLAGLLWIGGDAAFLTFVNAACEVLAAWLVYDTARRLSGRAAGVAAGVMYASAPMLAISTRLIWNPSLLPAAVALGCWLVVRYGERPTTWRLIAVALVCGLAMSLHATAIFPVAAWVVIAFLLRRPSWGQCAAAAVVGLLPLAPLLSRLTGATPSGRSIDTLFAVNDGLATLMGIGTLMLSFPISAYAEHWSAPASAAVLQFQAALGAVGLIVGLTRTSPYRPVWLGIAMALSAHLAGALVYSGHLAWYYFTGAVPLMCLCTAHAIGAWPRLRVGAAALMVFLALAHVVFVQQFDRRAIELGLIRFRPEGLVLRLPLGGATYGITLREIRNISTTLREVFPDGVTAMRASHGARAELWRESGAEFMPQVPSPPDEWSSEFVLMGAGATVSHPDARLLGSRVCLFDRSERVQWRVWPDSVPSGWALPAFADDRWYPLRLPRRMIGPQAGDFASPGLWRTPLQYLRGRLHVERPRSPYLYVVSLHSHGYSQHWIARFAVNGTDVAATKSRLGPSSVFRNEEWLFDLTGLLREGENVIAIAIDGQTAAFDVDAFELPCLDREWYNTR